MDTSPYCSSAFRSVGQCEISDEVKAELVLVIGVFTESLLQR